MSYIKKTVLLILFFLALWNVLREASVILGY